MPDEQLSLAIGRRGQNVRLASQLSGYEIDIMTEEEESAKRQEEFKVRSELFMAGLDVDDMMAGLLVSEGFAKIEEIAFVEVEELMDIDGLDEETAEELAGARQATSSKRKTKSLMKNAKSWVSPTTSLKWTGSI